jgi:hypothetical protein
MVRSNGSHGSGRRIRFRSSGNACGSAAVFALACVAPSTLGVATRGEDEGDVLHAASDKKATARARMDRCIVEARSSMRWRSVGIAVRNGRVFGYRGAVPRRRRERRHGD